VLYPKKAPISKHLDIILSKMPTGRDSLLRIFEYKYPKKQFNSSKLPRKLTKA
jgi:hypothetical protein